MPDYPLGDTLDFKFTTRAFATGVPTTLAGTPVIQIYEDNSVTQITAGITLTVDFDSVTGLNNVRVVATSGNGFGAGQSYACVITTGTVGGVSVVGEVVAQFSIQRAPVNWAEVTAPTTAVDLSGTDIQLCDTVTTLTGHTAQTGDSFARIGANGASLTALATQASVNTIDTNVDAILVDTGTDIPARFDGIEGATFATGTDSLEAIRNRGDAAWVTGSGTGLTPLASGTAQAGAAGTIQLAAASTFANDELNGNTIKITSGTGAGQSRVITDYVGATDTATVTPNWATNPDATSVYEVVDGSANVTAWLGATATALETAADVRTEMDANSTQLAAIVADTNELQGDWANGGRLDLILDSRMAEASINTTGGAVDNVTLVATTTTNTDMRGTDSAATAANLATVDANVDTLLLGVITGTAQTGTLSTTQATTDLTGYANDELIGRVIVFTGGTADGQASDITDYASASGLVTFTAIPTAPANGDTFKIV